MLAKNVNDYACFLNKRVAYGFFASKHAPTSIRAASPTFSSELPVQAQAHALGFFAPTQLAVVIQVDPRRRIQRQAGL